MQEETETLAPVDVVPVGYSASERALAAVMLVGLIGLAYICVDVLAGGRITRAITGRDDTP